MVETINYGADFSQLHPPRTYPRRTPGIFNAATHDRELLRWFFGQISHPSIDCPAEGFIYLPECYVFDGRHILSPDQQWIQASLADWDARPVLEDWIKDTIRRGNIKELNVRGTEWYYVLFAQCNSENYGHYLCEAAPKLANIKQAGLKKIRYILPENCKRYEAFTNAILNHMGIQSEAIVVPHADMSSIKDLLYFTPVSRHNFRKSPTLLEFRACALSLFGSKQAQDYKLFIKRSVKDRRRISNQEQIADFLADKGYHSVSPGNMSVPEQIEVFSRASHVIGSVGAGLTNILFSCADTRVLYVCNGVIDLFFWDIAGLCDLQFDWFFAQPPQRFTQEAFTGDFAVDLAQLQGALERSLT